MAVAADAPDFLVELADGTVKQRNPFTGTEVWTVPGRGDRPLGVARPAAVRLDPSMHGRHCAFCSDRVRETPPEKSRSVRDDDGTHRTLSAVPAEELDATVAEFRRVPNLFEILSYDYWHLNHGYELSESVRASRDAYLATEEGRAHVLAVIENKLRASGKTDDEICGMTEDERIEAASGFFGGGHDVVIARRHFVDGAETDHELASSGTLTPEEHREFIRFTAEAAKDLYAMDPGVRYVSVFQNWLKPAGASFDHLHKQLVAIDERGAQNEAVLAAVAKNPDVFEDWAVGYARKRGLVVAQNAHAVLFAGFGHRYPTLEVWSTAEASEPWEHSAEELGAVSDLLHAAHAATGADVPCNEEWHTRPAGVDVRIPWRFCLKWRVSTLAGFEGATKVNVNTVSPWTLRDRVLARLRELQADGALAAGIELA
ncbi:DUF4921 family protein [Micrococcus sp. FDAARGOS_333]|uniref:DUF4921 family protein n=1 Tax=Micrococcus sp. FDAARGOS_333 TaxID=1930558 RepID=UPI000B4DFFAF|nr:DUF4921 family protein [Micrococcus sp. FDAARGOS_333]PNL18354.1 DUF4921 domain-containing protein [Micrococcus sp. FDAARGOS_333]